MSERTFRAVVAAVLVGALALASVVTFVVLQPASPSPRPSATPTARPTPTVPSAPTPTPRLVFAEVAVSAVGGIPRGGASGTTLVLRFVESSEGAISGAAGSFTLTITDHAGSGTTVGFTGIPSLDAPVSLGATAELVAANVLKISIVASNTQFIEQITVTGLGIRASPEAALGSITATLGAFSGSMAGGVANDVLPSPGTVVAGQ